MEVSNVSKLHRFLGGLRGHLSKQGKVFKKWSLRYFHLEKRSLQCYIDESKTQPIGEVLIDESTRIYDVTEDVEGMKSLFYVIGRNSAGVDEVMFLSAPSEKEKQDWIEAIIDQVHDGFKQISQTDLWPTMFFPCLDITINYGSNVSAENGNILRPVHIETAPAISIKGVQPDERYSLIMLDMDCIPLIGGIEDRVFLHWGVINFANGDIKTGDEIVPYQAPAPLYESGLHRYFFLLFKQTEALTPLLLSKTGELFLRREGFPLQPWAQCMGFHQPAAINGFYAGWEEYCDILHQKHGLLPPDIYRSPGQHALVLAELEQQTIEQAKLELYQELECNDIFQCEENQLSHPDHPSYALTVLYHDSVCARDGGILTAKMTETCPTLQFKSPTQSKEDDCSFFLLLLLDPDEPSRVQPHDREYIHWMVVNIPSSYCDVTQGVEILPYESPAPAFGTGLHRYIFTFYKQSSAFDALEVLDIQSTFAQRAGIRSNQWIHTLSNKRVPITIPVGLEAFLCEWDEFVDVIHARSGFVPAVEYRSPSQRAGKMVHSPEWSDADQGKSKEQLWAWKEALEVEQSRKVLEAEVAFNQSLEVPDPGSPTEQQPSQSQTDAQGQKEEKRSFLTRSALETQGSNSSNMITCEVMILQALAESSLAANHHQLQSPTAADEAALAISIIETVVEEEKSPELVQETVHTNDEISAVAAHRIQEEQVAAKTITRTQLTTTSTPAEQCQAFQIESRSVFAGEVMKKKYSTDFMFKDSFVWIQPLTKSLHWSKSASDRTSNTKYIMLDRLVGYEGGSSKGKGRGGEMKGLLKGVEHNGLQIIVQLESGEWLELKVAQDGAAGAGSGSGQRRSADWVKVLRTFLAADQATS
jgi:phosphatidylethanolamine-binding protein (PEBP) family uncharacterized protein